MSELFEDVAIVLAGVLGVALFWSGWTTREVPVNFGRIARRDNAKLYWAIMALYGLMALGCVVWMAALVMRFA